jgi:hypothetical protein
MQEDSAGGQRRRTAQEDSVGEQRRRTAEEHLENPGEHLENTTCKMNGRAFTRSLALW